MTLVGEFLGCIIRIVSTGSSQTGYECLILKEIKAIQETFYCSFSLIKLFFNWTQNNRVPIIVPMILEIDKFIFDFKRIGPIIISGGEPPAT